MGRPWAILLSGVKAPDIFSTHHKGDTRMTILVAYVPRPEGRAALDKGIEIATRRNERLVGIICNLREQFTRFRSMSINYPGRLTNTLEEHKQLVEAIAQRNAELAQQRAREHIENAEQTLLLEMEQLQHSR